MKKIVLAVVVLAVVAATLGSAGIAFAQAPTLAAGYGFGWMAGRSSGGMMGAGNSAAGTGILHDYMIAAYSEALNVSVPDLEARLAAGESMAQIALSAGLTLDEFRTLMVEVRSTAIDNALADGVLTQAQADWLKQRSTGHMGTGRGLHGTGQGQYANPNCPYYAPTQP